MGTLKEGPKGSMNRGQLESSGMGRCGWLGVGCEGRGGGRWEVGSTRTQVPVWAALLEVWAASICSWWS